MRASSAAKWSAHLEAWKQSGLTMSAYASREGINVGTFGAWKRRLNRVSQPRLDVIEVRTVPGGSPTPFHLLINGIHLDVAVDFEVTALRRLLAVLEERR